MHVCGYEARRDTVVRHVALWFLQLDTLQWVVVFTSYAARHRIFLSWFY